MTTVLTIGHSRHAADHFLALLRAHEVGQLVDVRSQPCSKWSPHFDKGHLEQWLGAAGVDYVFLGRQLGGRPEGREFYRHDGTVDYDLRAGAIDFADGIAQLATLAADRQTVILCAEEDPTRCHRRLLITPALVRAGTAVVHIRGDARLEQDHDPTPAPTQLDLFGDHQ